MELPDPDRRAADDAPEPDFDQLTPPSELVRRGKTRDRIYTTVLQLNEPTAVAEVAERADADPGTVREYLRWFADLGVVRRTGDEPERYKANRGYLQWRRANKLSEEYRESELVRRLQAITEEIEKTREEFNRQTPQEIDIVDLADDRGEDIADVWRKVADWEAAEYRRETLQQALQIRRKSRQEPSSTSAMSSSDVNTSPSENTPQH